MLSRFAQRIIISSKAFESVKGYIARTTSGGPEYCGNMTIRYNPFVGYIVESFVKEQETAHSVECIPRIGDGQGLWHTHPRGLCGASSIDMNTMHKDAMIAVNGVTPGVPPVNLIMTVKNGSECVKGYLPTWKVEYEVLEVPPYVVSSIAPVLEGRFMPNPIYHYFGMIVHENTDPMTRRKYYMLTVVGDLDIDIARKHDNYGVYVNSHLPPHTINVILAFMSSARKEFWFYHELSGLMRVRVKRSQPEVIEVPVSVEPIGFGRELRIQNLEREYNIPINKLNNKTVAVLGAGFLGSRIIDILSTLVGRIIVLDIDRVGPENLGYQALYDVSTLGAYKAHAVTYNLLRRHISIRVIPVRSLISSPHDEVERVLEEIASKSDLIITSFDTLEPRLTVQMVATKYEVPLIDVAVGVTDGEIRIWYPNSGLACLGCYIAYEPRSEVGRSIYSSLPHLASILSGIVVDEAVRILLGNKPKDNRIRVVLSEQGLTVERESFEEDPTCPYHRKRCSVTLDLEGTDPLKTKLVVEGEPWNRVDNLLSIISKKIKRKFIFLIKRKNYKKIVDKGTLVRLCELQRFGYELTLYPLEDDKNE